MLDLLAVVAGNAACPSYMRRFRRWAPPHLILIVEPKLLVQPSTTPPLPAEALARIGQIVGEFGLLATVIRGPVVETPS